MQLIAPDVIEFVPAAIAAVDVKPTVDNPDENVGADDVVPSVLIAVMSGAPVVAIITRRALLVALRASAESPIHS